MRLIYAVAPKRKVSKNEIKQVRDELTKMKEDDMYSPIFPFGWQLRRVGE